MQILLALSAIIAVSTARVVITAEGPADLHLLGQEECTWGPSYWCENIKTAAGCNATKHCIKTIWNHMKVPEDNDDVCTVCKDMVQQARDQLESNQTQNDLKVVFEASCRLMWIKPVVHECIKIVDQFIPDLVETLASQMNPSVVCSVAGLCNSAYIDKLLEESSIKVAEMKVHSLGDDEVEPDECTKCYTVATHMEHKLKDTPRDKMLQQMLHSCAEFNTFTDACSAIILTNFETIYTHLQENFNAQNICHLSGQCSGKFHKHEDAHKTPEVEIRPLSSVGMVEVGDDLPCKLCEQLVEHLRDLLVANTTESEFRLVLDGLCKQTKSFSSECTAIVDEYYPEMYEYLTEHLNSNAICQMSGICPSPGKGMQEEPIWPLLPNNVAEVGVRMLKDSKKKFENGKHQELGEAEVESMQLPIERMLPFPISEGPLTVHGKVSCALCEYVLHYIQDSITNPVTEDKVKHAIERVCTKLPGTLRGECSEFVDTYGDAIVAILAQEIDPSQACPMLHFCPSQQLMNLWESVPSKYMLEEQKNKKPSCPLCLLAVSQVYNIIKNNKTEANIESVLDKLCIHLPRSLSEECTDLVKGYSKELVDLLLADLSPQEVCVYIKLCDDNKNTGPRNLYITDNSGEILTNEIPDTSVNFEIENDEGATCVVCEYAMQYVDKELGNERARNRVENSVRAVCKHLPKTLSQSCGQFVNKYGDAIINVITKDVSPKQVCKFMGLCASFMQEEFKAIDNDQETSVNFEISADTEGATCTVCEYAIKFIEKELGSEKGKNKVESAVHGVCKHLPKTLSRECNNFINKHGHNIIDIIVQNVSPRSVCKLIQVCSTYMQVDFEAIDEVPETSESSEIWEEEDKAITCTVCEYAMKVVDKAIGSNKGKSVVEGAVRGVCKHLPKFISRPCNKFINNHGDAVVNEIVKGASPKNVCGVIGLCSAYMIEEIEAIDKVQESLVDSEISEDTEGATCTVCEYAINFIEKELGSEKGKNKVESTVHGVCKHLPKTLSRECNNFINKHGDDIINKIVQNVSPRSVCKLIQVCSTYMQVDFDVIDEVPETSESSEIWEEEDKAITCTVCEYAMKVVDKEIGSNKGKSVVEGAVRGVCKHLPKFISRPCNKFINNHGDAVVNEIVKGASPKNVCGVIGLCSAYMIEEIEAIDKVQESLVDSEISEDNDGATCTVCEYAISFIEKELGSEKGKNKVEGAVHGVCKHFPKTLSRECNNFVNKHGDDIINKIVQNVSPKSVCKLIQACSTYMQVDFEETEKVPDTFENTDISEGTNLGPTCVVCELALRFIEKELGSEKGKDKVENAVHGVCKHLPKTLSRKCNTFVNKHGDTVIDAIVKGMNPNVVCTLSGLCILYKEEEFKASVVECATCKGVVSVIHELLADPKVDDTIVNVVSKACKHVPASKQSKCATLINIYGQSIINLIEQHTDSKKICGKVGLCASADYSSISLESARSKRSYEKDDIKRCTWGPVYWCSSNETALKCKAVEHCKENVWKAEFAPPKKNTLSVAEPNA